MTRISTEKPVVSILCITYNHAKFIKQTLDGFLMQETNFRFEVLVNDDASDDGTTDIIKEYQKAHPDIIKPVFHKENLYSQGVRGMFVRFLFPKARGKYIALCEGDDFWTSPRKLQTQVDFMNAHPDYSMCFHKVRVVHQKGEVPDQVYPNVPDESWYSNEELFKVNYIQTNSVLYRKQSYKNLPTNIMPGDWFLHLYHASFGKIKLIDEVMSVYRKHEGGVWWDYDKDREKLWRQHGGHHLLMWIELLKVYKDRKIFEDLIWQQITTMLGVITEIDKKYQTKILHQTLDDYPSAGEQIIVRQAYVIHEQEARNKNLEEKARHDGQVIVDLKADVSRLVRETEDKEKRIGRIEKSKVWRVRNAVVRRTGGDVI